MAIQALTRALKSFESPMSRVRVGRAEVVLAALMLAILGGVWFIPGAPRKAGSVSAASPVAVAAKAKTAAPQASSASEIAAPNNKANAFVPDKEHRSLESVFALLRATRWGKSFGANEESEEQLYAQNMFADGAYVAESTVFKGYYCLVAGGDEQCEADTLAGAVFDASDSKANAIGFQGMASAADFNAAFEKVQENNQHAAEALAADAHPAQASKSPEVFLASGVDRVREDRSASNPAN